jgi:hypothetical protein
MQHITVENVAALLGAFYTISSVLAAVLPKDSKAGLFFAKIAADLKGAHTPAGSP